jgi:hypothetical protein
LLAILVALAACNDHGVASLTRSREKICACKTASCAEQELKLVPQDTIQSTHRTQVIARDMLSCLAKLQASERPVTDPDAEDPVTEGSAAGSGTAGPSNPPPPAAAPRPDEPRTGAPGSANQR